MTLWLIFGVGGTKALTLSIFPRLNLLSDTRILLLYPTVPDLTLRIMDQNGNVITDGPQVPVVLHIHDCKL